MIISLLTSWGVYLQYLWITALATSVVAVVGPNEVDIRLIQSVAGTTSNFNSAANQSLAFEPTSIWQDTFGNVYYADDGNCTIRKISGFNFETVVTFAGTGVCSTTYENGGFYPTSVRANWANIWQFPRYLFYGLRKCADWLYK